MKINKKRERKQKEKSGILFHASKVYGKFCQKSEANSPRIKVYYRVNILGASH
jgi:hypothetical protein